MGGPKNVKFVKPTPGNGRPTAKSASAGGARLTGPTNLSIPSGTPKSSNAHPAVPTQKAPSPPGGPKPMPKTKSAAPAKRMSSAKADKDSTPGW